MGLLGRAAKPRIRAYCQTVTPDLFRGLVPLAAYRALAVAVLRPAVLDVGEGRLPLQARQRATAFLRR